MKKRKIWCSALLTIGVLSMVCGVIYPLSMTVIAQILFPVQTNGSQILIEKEGEEVAVGSTLLAQDWRKPEYLIGRYDTGAPSNQSAVSKEQEALIQERVNWWHAFDPNTKNTAIPDELVTGSGSGVDPHISVVAAAFQIERIARVRGMSYDAVRKIIEDHTTTKTLGFLGEDRVNVLMVNLSLDGYKMK